MPRRNSAVKSKSQSNFTSLGAVDLHFHGAFGIDLMASSSGPAQLNDLSRRLWQNGVSAFCPTTLSAPPRKLKEAVSRLGRWIRSEQAPGALPLGIHLEGPFISPDACGAHPPRSIRRLSFPELEALWDASQGTLKILTLAPERLKTAELKRLARFAHERKIILSLGHSHADETQAFQAFQAGFEGITHAWNASGFHHRSPGPLGAALGNPDIYLELIIDQVHVSPTLIDWTRKLHPHRKLCFVSDCVPATATPKGSWHSFGALRVRVQDGASRLGNGALAGGGILLPESFGRWAQVDAKRRGISFPQAVREGLVHLTDAPLEALGIPPASLARRRVQWRVFKTGKIQTIPMPISN